ncbi:MULTISPECIES: AAA family ATPase [Cyanophyceae]|uniref:AAA family ATPase n=1 Tax=Leptolyngbya subtilissima DQ-A4 TaxID=2933933 RepID=A0ABV0K9X2_9CYAN|nr:AAA family ATPase [Nodosilinea sp. FACHB-141]MBD2110864.1 AAA family ATPase [Nodosilinea sp. FACHB-141]
MPTRGLTLGKFAPLHKGHQLLIETALSEMDEVIVMIYDCPETTAVPLSIRANWIRQLYPTVKVIEAWDGPTEIGNTPEIEQAHETYILKQLQGNSVTHFYSREFYGEHMSQALGAVNRLVDWTPQSSWAHRTTVPISATQVRSNLYQYCQFLDPLIYQDLITHVVFLGAPSTGKTTLAEALARHYKTVWLPEYGREYWETHQVERRLSLEQLEEIATGHLEREEAQLTQANRYLFTDTNALTTYRFSLYYHGTTSLHLAHLAGLCSSRYDLVFLCETDISYDDTWDRSGEGNRAVFQKQIISDLVVRKVPFFRVSGDLQTRIGYVERILAQFKKYHNLIEQFQVANG